MSETITAESLKNAQPEQETDNQQDIDNSPDTKQDENLEVNESSEDNVNGDSKDQPNEETPTTGDSEDSENTKTDSQDKTDESKEDQSLEEKSDESEIPKWVKKRLQRERRKHERELNDLKLQNEQYMSTVGNNNAYFDQATQIQDPYTGNIVAKDSVEGQVVVKLQQLSQVQEEQEKQTKVQQAQENFKRRLEKGYDKFDDFREVVDNSGVTMPMLEAAYESENPDELLYNLAKYKPEEIDRISKLSPGRQFREMVLLENEMKQSTKKKIVKEVPEPPSKIKGSGSSAIVDEDDLTFEQLLRKARKEQTERLRR